MLLAVKPPNTSGFSSPDVYSASRVESKIFPSLAESRLGPITLTGESSPRTMSAPHRGLPPPLGMTLPAPGQIADRAHPPPPPPPQHQSSAPPNQPMGQLPAPPSSQWPGQGGGDAMRDWLAAKAEEDRRKQEEERTRQESLRLEQRKIEQSMLRESLHGGIPPAMVPIVFAGMGGGQLASAGMEWAHQYMSQMTAQQAHNPPQPQIAPSHNSPDIRRDRAYTGGPQPNPYAAHQPPQQRPYPFDNSRPGQAQIAAGPTSAPRPSASSLSRLNTGEMSIPPPVPPGAPLPIQHTHPHTQPEHGATSTPTSTAQGLYFHHWVPPNSTGSSKEAGSPSDFTHSPKRRKTHALGKTPETSPSFSHPSSSSRRHRAGSVQKSEASTEESSRGSGSAPGSGQQLAGHISRPSSRNRQHSLSSTAEANRHGSTHAELSQTVSPEQGVNGRNRKRSHSGTPKRDGSLS